MSKSKRLPIITMLVAFFNTLISIIVNLITRESGSFNLDRLLGFDPLIVIITLASICLLGLVVLWYRKGDARIVVKPTSLTLREKSLIDLYAHRGLIVLTSLWSPQSGASEQAIALRKRESIPQRLEAARRSDYKVLDITHSPLNNIIRAVETHKTRLEHCWFVCTQARDRKPESSSATYVPALIQYFKSEFHLTQPFFHPADETYISLDEKDSQIAVDTRDLINRIFDDAKARYGLQDSDIVCDFTGCPRSMAIGLFWACLDKKRDIQFIATEYDDSGAPVGVSSAILYSFETQVND